MAPSCKSAAKNKIYPAGNDQESRRLSLDEPTNSTLLNSCTPQDFEGCWMWFYDVLWVCCTWHMLTYHPYMKDYESIQSGTWGIDMIYRSKDKLNRSECLGWSCFKMFTCTLSMTSTSTKSSFRAAVSATFSKVRRINWQSLSNAEQRRSHNHCTQPSNKIVITTIITIMKIPSFHPAMRDCHIMLHPHIEIAFWWIGNRTYLVKIILRQSFLPITKPPLNNKNNPRLFVWGNFRLANLTLIDPL